MDLVTYALCKKYIQSSLEGAGALKGQKGDAGLSAYEIAKKNGYSGTEAQWLQSLKGSTPYIGENGNWYINNTDTNIPGKAIRSYNELQDLPEIPTEVSKFVNDAGFITINDIPTDLSSFNNDANFIAKNDNISDLTNDAGYITSNDLSNLALKSEIPTAVSQLTNDNNYLTNQGLKTINGNSLVGSGNLTISGAIDDVKVNGTSVVTDKIANIVLSNIDTKIGHSFTVNADVGYLKTGTVVDENTTVAELLYAMLFKDISSPTGINIFWGASLTPWNGMVDLRVQGNEENVNIDTLIAAPYICNISTGRQIGNNTNEVKAEFPTIITSKGARLVKLTMWKENQSQMSCDFNTIQTADSYIYYITTESDSFEEGGYQFALTFAEV